MQRKQRKNDADSKITDMLHLARAYEGGLGKLWHNQSEAARILGITYCDLRRGHLVCAAAVSSYPPEISSLFSAVGMSTSTVRSINKALKVQGISAVRENAIQIKAMGRTYNRAQLVSLISTKGMVSKRQEFNARKIFADYQVGLEKGQWSSMRDAEAHLGVDKRYIATARCFTRMPLEVTNLFREKSFTYDLCREVLEIQRIYGPEVLVRRARSIPAATAEQMTAIEITNVLSGLTHDSATVTPRIRVPRSKKSVIVEFHCTDGRFLLDRSNELMKIVEKGMASFIETALLTLGATPALPEK